MKRPPLEDIATIWLEHWDPTHRGWGGPTKAVADHYGVERQTATRWMRLVREAGLTPPGHTARQYGEHHPVRARLAGASKVTFLVCRECLVTWPCPEAPEAPLGNTEAPESRSTP